MVTAQGDLEDAVSGFRLGLTDFFRKPIDSPRCASPSATGWRPRACAKSSIAAVEAEVARSPIVGSSPALTAALQVMHKVAASNATAVLLEGESGTGKDLMAKAIHEASERPRRAVHSRELCRAAGDPARIRALRPREGGVHRRESRESGAVRAGRRRHALPRRDRRLAAGAAGEAAAGNRGSSFRRLGGVDAHHG